MKHLIHISYIANIPTTNILVKGICANKHPRHISYLANIPITNILVKGGCFVDIVGNTNTAIAKNTTKISDLKDQVDIDGSGFDVVLTSRTH
jgi:hypothetical protein